MTDAIQTLVTNPTISGIALAVVGAVCGLWLAAAWWTYSDAARRTSSELPRLLAAGWVLVSSPLLLPLSLGAYLLVRPQRTAAEQRSERLFAAMAGGRDDRCPTCGRLVESSWHRCPDCESWLASACVSCSAWSSVDLDICPWCAHDKPGVSSRSRSTASPLVVPGTIAAARSPGPALGASSVAVIATAPPAAAGTRRSPRSRTRPEPVNRGARGRRAEGADRTAGSESLEVGS